MCLIIPAAADASNTDLTHKVVGGSIVHNTRCAFETKAIHLQKCMVTLFCFLLTCCYQWVTCMHPLLQPKKCSQHLCSLHSVLSACLPAHCYMPQENDIILCDGECMRAFHACCVQPPLTQAELEKDDAWLCPACTCKVCTFFPAFPLHWFGLLQQPPAVNVVSDCTDAAVLCATSLFCTLQHS
jgi:hypothetical protein